MDYFVLWGNREIMKAHRLAANYIAELEFIEQIIGDDVSEVLVMFVTVDSVGTTRNISKTKCSIKLDRMKTRVLVK